MSIESDMINRLAIQNRIKVLSKQKPNRTSWYLMSRIFKDVNTLFFIKDLYCQMVKMKKTDFWLLTDEPRIAKEFYEAYPEFESAQNIHLGTCIQSQNEVYTKGSILASIKAHNKYLMLEPLVSPLNISFLLRSDETCGRCGGTGKDGKIENEVCRQCNGKYSTMQGLSPIDWVICSASTGTNATPMHPYWINKIKDDCEEARVPFYIKSNGEFLPEKRKKFFSYNHFLQQNSIIEKNDVCISWDGIICKTASDFLNCQYPVYVMKKVGKKVAGSLLNGKEYKQMPILIPQ